MKPDNDPSRVSLPYARQSLESLFSPQTVAVIGATEKAGSVGRVLLWNLISTPFGGTVFPVNPRRANVLGIKAYPTVTAVPEAVDLALVITPAPTVPDIISECVEAGVKGAIIISDGFREIGESGAELERKVLEQARRGPLRILGPNCLGVMRPRTGLNATIASRMARPGNVGFISQSGALCTAVLDWSLKTHVGFSAFISAGSMADVGWGDLIHFLGDDPHTRSIIMYMETIGDPRSFLSAAREVAYTKPIIVIKSGRTDAAARAASSHTGELAGSDEVLEAAFRRSGILRVDYIHELFYMAEVLAKQPRPKGPHLTILTNSGAAGVVAADSLLLDRGELTQLSEETLGALDELLPSHWSHGNPVDILGDADPNRYVRAVELAAQDPNSDGLLVVLTPQVLSDPTQTAERLKPLSTTTGKPILASWMGGADVAAGEAILNRANIPTFAYPDTAARMFNYMWRYSYNLRSLYETPTLAPDTAESGAQRARVREILERARETARTLLTEFESKQVLSAYGIPVVETRVATNVEEAVLIAEEIGYPVVLKLHSEAITHKSEVGGVQLNLINDESVRRGYRAIETSVQQRGGSQLFLGVTVQPMIQPGGYELIVGSSIDPQFGPVLLFGIGGQLVEVLRDRAWALPPLTTTLARRMMEQTRIFQALRGDQGCCPVDLDLLEQMLVRFSQMVLDQPWIKEIEINPLLSSSDRLLALDARVVLHDADVKSADLPQPAIRPYPTQYMQEFPLQDGTTVTFRPIRPEDEPLLISFHERLSERSVYLRYMHLIKLSQRVAHDRLCRICFIDYDAEMVIVADREHPETKEHEILGVGRLNRMHGANEAELAAVIRDDWHHQGLGSDFVRLLLQIGRNEGLDRVTAEILEENYEMQHICKKLGFYVHGDVGDEIVRAEIQL